MDTYQLAAQIAILLTPLLPYLVLGGNAAAQEMGKQVSQAALDKAKEVWSIVSGVEEDDDFRDGAITLVNDPTNTAGTPLVVGALVRHLQSNRDAVERLRGLVQDRSSQKINMRGSKVGGSTRQSSIGSDQNVDMEDSEISGDLDQDNR